MTPESIVNLIRDILVIGYMFVLRIGVPLIITLMVGAWLRKMLEEKPAPEEKEETAAAAAPAKVKPH